jgi:hypothetical protein
MQSSLQWLRYTLIPALIGCVAACGGSDGSEGSAYPPAAVSSSPSWQDPASPAASKVVDHRREPATRPGIEAPLDSAPDRVSKQPGHRLFATGFEAGVSLRSDLVAGSGLQQISGGDTDGYQFPISLGDSAAAWPSRVHAEVGDRASIAPQTFARASLRTVAGRGGDASRVMSLNSLAKSHAIHAQQISLESAGLIADPVIYQRMWIKFDVGTLDRARQHGADRFYQTFWEVRGNGSFTLRLKLHMADSEQLVWIAKASGVAGSEGGWTARLDSAPVVLAEEASAAGWHQVEIWLDAAGSRFKVSIDGQPLVDRGDVRAADGESIETYRMMMVGSTVAPLAEVLFDDLEFWSAPPADAFTNAGLPPTR